MLGVQLGVDLHGVDKAGVVKGARLYCCQAHVLQGGPRSEGLHTLMITLLGKEAPSRHMVEPQSPLLDVSWTLEYSVGDVPEMRNDLVTTITLCLVLLCGTLGNLETLIGKE